MDQITGYYLRANSAGPWHDVHHMSAAISEQWLQKVERAALSVAIVQRWQYLYGACHDPAWFALSTL